MSEHLIPKTSTTGLLVILMVVLTACTSPEEKAAEYIESGNEYFEQGDRTKAALQYRNALQINENLTDAIYGLARIAEAEQEWRRMFGLLVKIQELNPNHLDARVKLAQIYLATGQISVALEEARALLELIPDDSRSHALMAAVHYRLGNHAEGLEEVRKAHALDPNNTEASVVEARILIDAENYDSALTVLNQAIAKDSDNVSLYLMKIQLFENTGRIEKTTEVLLELTEKYPDEKEYQYALARNYQRNGDLALTEQVFRKIIEGEPDNHAEKLRLVNFVRQTQTLEAAVALVEQYIGQYSDVYGFQFALGELLQSDGRIDEAIAIYEKIIDADGTNPDGLEARNKVALLQLRQAKVTAAKALIDEVLAIDRESESALMLLAALQIDAREFDGAIVSLRTVLRNNPDAIRAHAMLGRAYALSGSSGLAIDAYTNGYRISPASPVVVNSLAELLLRQRKFDLADEILTNSIGSGNRNTQTLIALTQTKLALQQWDAAETLARQLSEIEGEQARSEQILGLVYQGKNLQEESISAFKRAHDLAPESAQPVVSLVRAQVRNGRIDEARSFLNSILSVSDNNVVAHLLLGQLSVLENEVAQAEPHFRRVIELSPRAVVGYRSLAGLYLQQDDAEAAVNMIQQGLAEIPDNPFLSISLASIYERQRNFDAAIDLYDALLSRDDSLLIARNNLASLLTDHRSDQASYDRARIMAADLRDSQIPQFRDTYAWAAVKSGINLEEAVVILQGIVEENDQVDIYHYHLGEAYRKQGDPEKAIAHLTKAETLAAAGSDIAVNARAALDELLR